MSKANVCVMCATVEEKNNPFHRFPRKIEHRQKWIKACNLTATKYRSWWRVCSKHFKETDFDRSPTWVLQLRSSAVPAPSSIGKSIKLTYNNSSPSSSIVEVKDENYSDTDSSPLMEETKRDVIEKDSSKVEQISNQNHLTHQQIKSEELIECTEIKKEKMCTTSVIHISPSGDVSVEEKTLSLDETLVNMPVVQPEQSIKITKIEEEIHIKDEEYTDESEEKFAEDQQKKIPSVRNVEELQPHHFSTPELAKIHLDFVKDTVKEQRKTIRCLTMQRKRLEEKFNSLEYRVYTVEKVLAMCKDKQLLEEAKTNSN